MIFTYQEKSLYFTEVYIINMFPTCNSKCIHPEGVPILSENASISFHTYVCTCMVMNNKSKDLDEKCVFLDIIYQNLKVNMKSLCFVCICGVCLPLIVLHCRWITLTVFWV